MGGVSATQINHAQQMISFHRIGRQKPSWLSFRDLLALLHHSLVALLGHHKHQKLAAPAEVVLSRWKAKAPHLPPSFQLHLRLYLHSSPLMAGQMRSQRACSERLGCRDQMY